MLGFPKVNVDKLELHFHVRVMYTLNIFVLVLIVKVKTKVISRIHIEFNGNLNPHKFMHQITIMSLYSKVHTNTRTKLQQAYLTYLISKLEVWNA